MAIKHTVQFGESLPAIAEHYGFGSVEPITAHPDNQQLLNEREIQPGDILAIPGGKEGESNHGTGRGHDIVVQAIHSRFRIRLWAALNKENPQAVGDFALRDKRSWYAFGKRPVYQIEATIDVALIDGGPKNEMPTGGSTNPKTGIYETAALGDGSWSITINPIASELSSGPIYGDAAADHGLGHYTAKGGKKKSGKPSKPFPNNGFFELEFRPLALQVDVKGGTIVSAHITTARASTRPHHAVLFWLNCEDVPSDTQVLDVDWKPDFIRRNCTKVRPEQKPRKSSIDIIQIHHTAGTDIGSALHGFLAEGEDSGAHYLVDIDGHVVRIADDRYNTKHGGGGRDIRTPSWGNETKSINDRAVGIEHVNTAPDLDEAAVKETKHLYTDAQYDASIGLIRSLIQAHGVKLKNVIGHQDAVAKAMCPGWVVDWPRLEKAGVALGPTPLDPAELETMFGGFFAGADGKGRKLPLESTEKAIEIDGKTTVSVMDKKVAIVEGLAGHPVEELRQALLNIGYSVDVFIADGGEKHEKTPGEFGKALGYALSQFIRHYCTGVRLRLDLRMAYRDSPRIWSDIFVDFNLAKLIKEVEKSALLLP